MPFKRLYEQFQPTSYNLKLKLDKTKLRFSGEVAIIGQAKANALTIGLHAKDLIIKQVLVDGVSATFSKDDNDTLIIEPAEKPKRTTKIEIRFNGKITKPMHGLYPCYTKSGDIILATQFESHHAREVFPCLDEPEAKATFELELTTEKNQTVLSNMPKREQFELDGSLVTSFEPSPIMSTYLLAFVVGEMQQVSKKTKTGIEVNIYSSLDHQKDSLNFALEVATKATDFFNDYFDTPYPLPKCDHVALPDFSSGAMENWGLITYREVCLIVDQATASTAVQEFAATVIAHELSHQWFGNLVTMKWWDDLWLNESFATLMEYLAVDHLYPNWNIMESFAAHEALGAFRRDSLKGVQSVQTAVNHPDEISTLFDTSIVYAKGARLLFMAYNLIGEQAFRAGLKNYFKKYAYQNTVGENLWDELSSASKMNVNQIMNAWISNSGFPILFVDQSKQNISLKQRKFETIGTKPSSTIWPIPLFSSSATSPVVMNQAELKVHSAQKEPVLFNTLGGHYSVRYVSALSQSYIENQITTKKIAPAQRLFYLNDLLLQARNGLGSITDFMNSLQAYDSETSEPVWNVMALGISDARRLIENVEPAETQMKNLTYKLIEHEYHRLGWQKKSREHLNTTKLREVIIALAAYSENKKVIKTSLNLYRTQQLTSLPADLRAIILRTALKHGPEDIFNELFAMYPTEKNSEIKQDICGALTSTKDPRLAKRIVMQLKDDNWVKKQDVDRFIVNLLANRWTKELAWKWLTSNWAWIEKMFASDKSYDNYPRYAASTFNNAEWLERYQQFFGPMKKIVALKRNIVLGELEIKNRIKWASRDQQKLIDWLKQAS
ncbi:M1 family metallopeptidase [Candidatus Nomurabacteria bacterium]|nr:M1 family metallopeptidase [Candidatus Nomurabacteria bacterium]